MLPKTIDSNVIYGNIYVNIKNDMANILENRKESGGDFHAGEGVSIRAIERITGVNQNTIMSLGRVGDACQKIMDEKMRGPELQANRG